MLIHLFCASGVSFCSNGSLCDDRTKKFSNNRIYIVKSAFSPQWLGQYVHNLLMIHIINLIYNSIWFFIVWNWGGFETKMNWNCAFELLRSLTWVIRRILLFVCVCLICLVYLNLFLMNKNVNMVASLKYIVQGLTIFLCIKIFSSW